MPDVADVREVIKEMKMKSEAAVAEPSEPSEPSEPADGPAIDQWVGDSTEVVEFFKTRQRRYRDHMRAYAAKQGRSLLGPMQMPGVQVRQMALATSDNSFW